MSLAFLFPLHTWRTIAEVVIIGVIVWVVLGTVAGLAIITGVWRGLK